MTGESRAWGRRSGDKKTLAESKDIEIMGVVRWFTHRTLKGLRWTARWTESLNI